MGNCQSRVAAEGRAERSHPRRILAEPTVVDDNPRVQAGVKLHTGMFRVANSYLNEHACLLQAPPKAM